MSRRHLSGTVGDLLGGDHPQAGVSFHADGVSGALRDDGPAGEVARGHLGAIIAATAERMKPIPPRKLQGAFLAGLLKDAGLEAKSAKHLAVLSEKARLSTGAIRDYLCERRAPSVAAAKRLAAVLRVTIDETDPEPGDWSLKPGPVCPVADFDDLPF